MRVSEVPKELPVFQTLAKHYHFSEAVADVSTKISGLQAIPLINQTALANTVIGLVEEYGLFSPRNSDGNGSGYDSLSLVQNPNVEGMWQNATLGSENLKASEFYWGNSSTFSKVGDLKNSYYDSYGFSRLTPAGIALQSHLEFKRNLIRSRISAIRADTKATTSFTFGWHKDEPVFENFRFNIPITTSPEYLLQIEKERENPFFYSRTMETTHLAIGSGYFWDTSLPHRVYSSSPGKIDRINIVLGFSPWFDYNPENDEWLPNEFFGKKHPFDMMYDGDILAQK
jgi:hypothetical protein